MALVSVAWFLTSCSAGKPEATPPSLRARLPECLRVVRVERGQLAYVIEHAEAGGQTVVLDIERGYAQTVNRLPLAVAGWSPSGSRLLVGACVLERHDGTLAVLAPFWAPLNAVPGAADWLALPTGDGALIAIPFPGGRAHELLPPESFEPGGASDVVWAEDGWLAWSRTSERPSREGGEWQQTIYVRPVSPGAKEHSWDVSDDVRLAYFQLLDWVPGRRLLLAARGSLADFLSGQGIPLVTLDPDSGDVTELEVSMLLTAEAYAWHPTRPGFVALADGDSRYLYETGRLVVLDVVTGERHYLTGDDLLAFEPTWSPDGNRLAFAGVAASPESGGDGEVRLDGRSIYVVEGPDGPIYPVTNPKGAVIDGWPQWSAEGSRLLYARQHDGYTDVHLLALNGTRDEILASGLGAPTCYDGGCGWRRLLAYNRLRELRLPARVLELAAASASTVRRR